MPPVKMHPDEADLGATLVAHLVEAQFPNLAGLPVREVNPRGTVNAVFRVGDDLCARLPRRASGCESLMREWRLLPLLAPNLPLAVPEPVAQGRPDVGYPFPWAIYRWIEGEPYGDERVEDERQAARDLARFVTELRRMDPAGAPAAGRAPLRDLDQATRAAIESCDGGVDRERTLEAWRAALEAPPWDREPVWIHGDLLRSNVLVREGRICAIVDFGALGAGDPAADVVAAFSMFGAAGRAVFREALDVDAGTWRRARGYALHQAALIMPYYARTNPAFAAAARRTLEEVLEDRT
jgi:aminoglycoside phosphotransferase (APT) family kinase protein